MLARRIAKELDKLKPAGINEPELSRIWPHYGKPREPQIAFFGEQRGCPLRYYKDGFCAIFR